MTHADMDAWAADLRRSVGAATGTDNTGVGLVIYVGDMRWAVDSSNDDARGFSPAAHLAAELARLLGELRLRAAEHGHGGRAWLVEAASYGTFMRCQRSSLEVTWDLQPVKQSCHRRTEEEKKKTAAASGFKGEDANSKFASAFSSSPRRRVRGHACGQR